MEKSNEVKRRNQQFILLTILAADYKFTVDRDKYNDFVNTLAAPGKRNLPQVNHNFLVKCVDEGSREGLIKILDDNPGSEMEIAGALIEKYVPDLGIVAKKLTT